MLEWLFRYISSRRSYSNYITRDNWSILLHIVRETNKSMYVRDISNLACTQKNMETVLFLFCLLGVGCVFVCLYRGEGSCLRNKYPLNLWWWFVSEWLPLAHISRNPSFDILEFTEVFSSRLTDISFKNRCRKLIFTMIRISRKVQSCEYD